MADQEFAAIDAPAQQDHSKRIASRIKAMHNIAIDPQIRARGFVSLGIDPPPRPLDPRRTAHLIVDLQNGFMEEGAPYELPVARTIVPAVNRVSRALRDAGGLNVFIRWAPFLAGAPYWSSLFDMLGEDARQVVVDSFTEGAHHHALWEGLDVEDDEPIVDKARFSAFIPGTCDLHELLQARGIDTLIVTGCLTNGCCESTARTGMEMGYRVLFVADGTAAVTDQEHKATLTMFAGSKVAEVVMADDVVRRIEAGAEVAATA
jgi:ureidoacrylate peracid hydrolase